MAEAFTALSALGSKLVGAAMAGGSWLGANAGTIGTVLSAGSSIYSGIRANEESKMQAKALRAKGDAEYASAQHKAIQARKEAKLAQSRARAVAGASGGGVGGDGSVDAVLGRIENEGDYNAMVDMYRGSVARNDLYTEANTTRREGRDSLISGFLNAGSSIYDGIERRRRLRLEYSR